MADKKQKKLNKYEEFMSKYAELAQFNQGAQDAYQASGDLSPAIRDLAASATNDDYIKADLQNNADKRDITNFLGDVIKLRKEGTNQFAKDNLESLLKDSPKQDVEIAIKYVIDPIDSYSGKNAKTYEEASKLQNQFRDMIKVKDPKKIKDNVKEFFKEKYSGKESEDDSKLVQSYVESSSGFAQRFYSNQIAEKDQEINEKLKGKEAGYLAENIKDKDFLELYGNLMQVKQKLTDVSKER
jgi:hypothetical protein